jgi:hypothetical protein
VPTTITVTGPKKYTAAEIRLFQKVLHGAPLGPEFVVPFGLKEVINPFVEVASTLKNDERLVQCVILPSQIDHPDAGEGLYAGANFPEGHRYSLFCCQLRPLQSSMN